MEEIKVNDYVRIKNGSIRKIIAINEGKEKIIFGKYRLDKDYNNCRSVAEKKIVKHSPNIIDLIEEGDYVNGEKVVAIDYDEDEKGNYYNVLGIMNIDDDFAYSVDLRAINIKSIVTKEQFNQVKYEV